MSPREPMEMTTVITLGLCVGALLGVMIVAALESRGRIQRWLRRIF